jgi:hypothetical protein
MTVPIPSERVFRLWGSSISQAPLETPLSLFPATSPYRIISSFCTRPVTGKHWRFPLVKRGELYDKPQISTGVAAMMTHGTTSAKTRFM